jgi:hypothetical protein
MPRISSAGTAPAGISVVISSPTSTWLVDR